MVRPAIQSVLLRVETHVIFGKLTVWWLELLKRGRGTSVSTLVMILSGQPRWRQRGTRTLIICVMTVTASLAYGRLRAAEHLLLRESFDDPGLVARGWYDGATFRIATSARAGAGCIEYEWGPGDRAAKGSSGARHAIRPTEEVFVRFYLKLSAGWDWSGRDYHPHLVHFLTTENSPWHGPAASHLTLYIEPVNGKLRLAATDIQNKDSPHGLTQGPLKGGFNGRVYDSREKLFADDQWHCIEAQFKLNTLDRQSDRPNRDGIVRGWFDGRLVIEQTDVVLRSTDFPSMKFNQFLMTPYFGPGLLPHPQKLWIDELVIANERVGP